MSSGRDILLAMSGGVDSTAAAVILRNSGWNVIGLTLDMGYNDNGIEKAAEACEKLGIDHIIRDCRAVFEKNVISLFIREYEYGRTPSPCVICNRTVKFSEMLAAADDLQIEYIATGHYAKRITNPLTGLAELFAADDTRKDQSYMLCMLTPEQLKRTLFPLSAYTKKEIRALASAFALPNASLRDSQDVCFDGGDYRTFLSGRGVKFREGKFIDLSGKELGCHKGLPGYTPGQRRGLGISAVEPLYVLRKDTESNTVTLCYSDNLGMKKIFVDSLSWISETGIENGTELEVKIRYSHRAQKCRFDYTPDGAVLSFYEPQRAPAPGQIAAFYLGDKVLGGGVITGAEK